MTGSHVPPPRVKICGLTRREDVSAADELGADYLGVVLTAGFGRSVDPGEAAVLVEGASALRVAVLVDEPVDRMEALATGLGAAVLQLHGSEPPEALAELRERGPWALWKSVRAKEIDDVVAVVRAYEAVADGILVEGWKDGVVGGGGAVLGVDGGQVREAVPGSLDLILAGGLTPETVAGAVSAVAPDVVDVSSGVESELRVKDVRKLRLFVESVRSGAPPRPGALAPGAGGL